MKRIGIRSHVAWLSIAPLLIMAITLESFFLHERFVDMDQDLLERSELVAHQLAASSEYGVFSNNQAFLQDIARSAQQQPDIRGVVILNKAGKILASAGDIPDIPKDLLAKANLAAINPLDRQEFTQIKQLKNDAFLSNSQSDIYGLRLYHPIVPTQVDLGGLEQDRDIPRLGTVILEISKLRTEQLKTRTLWITVLATLFFLSVSFYFVYRAGLNITRPIRRLSEAVQAIGEGKLDSRVSLHTNIDEISTLAQGMNEMTALLQEERTILQQRIDDATQALRAKKEWAERASHDKSRFLAVASHDLRQPLHALGLYVAELQQRVSNDDALQRLVGQVEQSVEALSMLLNALLDISKLDANVVVPQMQPCSLKALLQRVAADYQALARIKNIRLIIRPCSGYITSDPQLLERILMNLVSNAIRYTPKNGCVMIACRRRGNCWRIEVRDSGVGITEIDQINIFREFFRLSNPQVNTDNGLGLGLSIVDRLVKLLGHTLKLHSAPGKGSVFAVEAPVAINIDRRGQAALQSKEEPQKTEISPLAKARLLVVDDDATVLTGTANLLASWGCKVSVAASLTEVEHLLQNGETWDFIISDYQLGDNNANGIEVIATVRQHQNKQVPCILISGDTSQAVLKLASVNGHHLLHKPVKPAKLKSLILHALRDPTGLEEVA
jgi:signal transduction histidine kinase/ActR/RegA family two-component response regulator